MYAFHVLNALAFFRLIVGHYCIIASGILAADNLAAILADLLWFNLTVILGLLVYVCVCLPIIAFVFAKEFPLQLAKSQISVAMTAFAVQSR